jgi:hypothetical protein
MVLTPEEAATIIKAKREHGPFRVSGRLDLTGLKEARLPKGLHCYELDATNSELVSLPDDLRIDGRLVLDNCVQLRSLPPGLTAGSISLRNCSGLVALPEQLSTWFLDLTGCTRFEAWPRQGTIHGGSLILRGCRAISSLPGWIGRLAQLNLADCSRLREIPDGIAVTSWLDIGGTGITSLPLSLTGVALRWRGVRVNSRIAFHPEQLTAKETLAERNAEVRRVMIERMGYLRFAQEANAKVLDRDQDAGGPRQLLSIDLEEDEPLVGLSCRCPSTGRQYFLRVPPTMNTCHQAAAWMAGYDDPLLYRPKIET